MPHATAPLWKSEAGIALPMLLLIGLFYLVREHAAHASQLLPYLILLLCPLMHLFGHRHGHHRHGETHVRKDETRK